MSNFHDCQMRRSRVAYDQMEPVKCTRDKVWRLKMVSWNAWLLYEQVESLGRNVLEGAKSYGQRIGHA